MSNNEFLIILCILVGHYVGDWVFQDQDMATNKHKLEKDYFDHILIYGCFLLAFSAFGMLITGKPSDSETVNNFMKFIGYNIILHATVDSITSQMTTYFKTKKKEKAFWNTIGADQLIHMVCLIGTAKLWIF